MAKKDYLFVKISESGENLEPISNLDEKKFSTLDSLIFAIEKQTYNLLAVNDTKVGVAEFAGMRDYVIGKIISACEESFKEEIITDVLLFCDKRYTKNNQNFKPARIVSNKK